MNCSNNMREKIIYIFLIFWCQNVKNSDLFSKKIYYDYIEPFSQIDKVEFGEHVYLEFQNIPRQAQEGHCKVLEGSGQIFEGPKPSKDKNA